jgi:hypothetical protein
LNQRTFGCASSFGGCDWFTEREVTKQVAVLRELIADAEGRLAQLERTADNGHAAD